MQKQAEILTQHVPGQPNRSSRGGIPARWTALAQPKRLGLLAALVVATGVALPVLSLMRPPESAPAARQATQATQATNTTSELDSNIETYRQAEAGAHGSLTVPARTPAEQLAAEGLYFPEAPDYIPALPDNAMSSTAALAERLQAEGTFFPEAPDYLPGVTDRPVSSTATDAGSVPDNGLDYYADEDGAGFGYTGDGFGHPANGFATRESDAPTSSGGTLMDPALVDGSLHPDSADRTSTSAITDEAARLADGFGYYGEQP